MGENGLLYSSIQDFFVSITDPELVRHLLMERFFLLRGATLCSRRLNFHTTNSGIVSELYAVRKRGARNETNQMAVVLYKISARSITRRAQTLAMIKSNGLETMQ